MTTRRSSAPAACGRGAGGSSRRAPARREPRQHRLAHEARRDRAPLRRGLLGEQRRALAGARHHVGDVALAEVALQRLPGRGERRQVRHQRGELDLDEVDDGGADRRDDGRRQRRRRGQVEDAAAQLVFVGMHRHDLGEAETAQFLEHGVDGVIAEAGQQRRRHGQHAVGAGGEPVGRVQQRQRAGVAGGDAAGAVDAEVMEDRRAARRARGWPPWGRRRGSGGSRGRARRRCPATRAARPGRRPPAAA